MSAGSGPRHVGIIPDGNRRWARLRGVGLPEAYRRGYENLVSVIEALHDMGVPFASVYAVSRENCVRRGRLELEILRRLSLEALERLARDPRVAGGETRVVVLGDPGMLGGEVAARARRLALETRWNSPYTLTVLICYSTASEAERAARGFEPASTLTLPPLDLVVRTGGYTRLSGFLPLLADYAELYFTETLWPDFTRERLVEAIEWFRGRRRNFGR